jgi:hypothetical protein
MVPTTSRSGCSKSQMASGPTHWSTVRQGFLNADDRRWTDVQRRTLAWPDYQVLAAQPVPVQPRVIVPAAALVMENVFPLLESFVTV